MVHLKTPERRFRRGKFTCNDLAKWSIEVGLTSTLAVITISYVASFVCSRMVLDMINLSSGTLSVIWCSYIKRSKPKLFSSNKNENIFNPYFSRACSSPKTKVNYFTDKKLSYILGLFSYEVKSFDDETHSDFFRLDVFARVWVGPRFTFFVNHLSSISIRYLVIFVEIKIFNLLLYLAVNGKLKAKTTKMNSLQKSNRFRQKMIKQAHSGKKNKLLNMKALYDQFYKPKF